MGASFFDQSKPVRLLLTPYNAPIQVPATGGEFNYLITLSNCTNSPLTADLWCSATLPSLWVLGPLWDSLAVPIPAEGNVSIVCTQRVPGIRPGVPKFFSYQGYAATGLDTSSDSFTGCRLALDDRTESSRLIAAKEALQEELLPSDVILYPCHPNPFNPTTTIRYELRAASHVSLKVYDTAGRLVTTLIDGWRTAGSHEMTFDGSQLATGVYLYTLIAGQDHATGKMVLLK
jgi:hypothetical protein